MTLPPQHPLLHNSTSYHPYNSSYSPLHSNSTLLEPKSPLAGFLASIGVPDDEENLKRWSSFIGICIAIAGNVLISLALNVQKWAHVRLEREKRKREEWLNKVRRRAGDGSPSEETRLLTDIDGAGEVDKGNEEGDKDGKKGEGKSYTSSPLWWLGLTLMFFGECGNFLAYGFAPASIVSPLGVVALISNCVIAPVMLKEPFRGRDGAGVVVSILGAVCVVMSAEKEEVKLGPDDLLSSLSQPFFLLYLFLTLTLIIILLPLSRRHGHRTILLDLTLVALFGGYTVLSTKAISSLISSSLFHIFAYPIAYPLTAVLASTAVLQVKYLNRALQRFDSTQVIPTQFVLFTMSVIIGSAVLYRDFENVGLARLGKFAGGCGMTFVGVYLISSKRPKKTAPTDELTFDPEDAASSTTGTAAEDSAATTPRPPRPHHGRNGSEHIPLPPSSSSSARPRPVITRAPSSAAVEEGMAGSIFESGGSMGKRRVSEAGEVMVPGVMTGVQIGEVIKSRGRNGSWGEWLGGKVVPGAAKRGVVVEGNGMAVEGVVGVLEGMEVGERVERSRNRDGDEGGDVTAPPPPPLLPEVGEEVREWEDVGERRI